MRLAKVVCAIVAAMVLAMALPVAADEVNIFELSVENGNIVDGEYQVYAGETLIVNAVKGGEWENAAVEWSSSDIETAYVVSGVVYAQKMGHCTITATATVASTGASISASIKVYVLDVAPTPTSVAIRSSGGLTTVEKGDVLQMLADVSPAGVGVVWTSSRPAIIAVDGDGLLTGLKAGKSIITATADDGSGASDSMVISVNVVPVSINLNVTKKELYVGGTTKRLTSTGVLRAKVKPAAADTSVTWTSSNPSVVQVGAKGKLFALKKGSAVITATTVNGLKAKCTITVYKLPTVVWLPALKKVYVGKKINLGSFLKINGDIKTVQWASGNVKIAKVNQKGVVLGVKPGQCRIIVKAVNGKSDVCIMNVYAAKNGLYDELMDDPGIYDGMPTEAELRD